LADEDNTALNNGVLVDVEEEYDIEKSFDHLYDDNGDKDNGMGDVSDEDIKLWCKWHVTRGHSTDEEKKEMDGVHFWVQQATRQVAECEDLTLAIWHANKKISERLKGTPACNLDATFRRSESSKSKWEVSRGYIIGIEVAIYGTMCG